MTDVTQEPTMADERAGLVECEIQALWAAFDYHQECLEWDEADNVREQIKCLENRLAALRREALGPP